MSKIDQYAGYEEGFDGVRRESPSSHPAELLPPIFSNTQQVAEWKALRAQYNKGFAACKELLTGIAPAGQLLISQREWDAVREHLRLETEAKNRMIEQASKLSSELVYWKNRAELNLRDLPPTD